jgi:hypothetical protein
VNRDYGKDQGEEIKQGCKGAGQARDIRRQEARKICGCEKSGCEKSFQAACGSSRGRGSPDCRAWVNRHPESL